MAPFVGGELFFGTVTSDFVFFDIEWLPGLREKRLIPPGQLQKVGLRLEPKNTESMHCTVARVWAIMDVLASH